MERGRGGMGNVCYKVKSNRGRNGAYGWMDGMDGTEGNIGLELGWEWGVNTYGKGIGIGSTMIPPHYYHRRELRRENNLRFWVCGFFGD